MSLLPKTLFFAFFIVTGPVFYASAYVLARMQRATLMRGKHPLVSILVLSLLTDAFVVLMIYCLAHFWSWPLTALLVGTSFLGFIVMGSVAAVKDFSSIGHLDWWFGLEAALHPGRIAGLQNVTSMVVVLLFPVAAGAIYWSHDVPSPRLTVIVLKLVFAFAFVLFLPLFMTHTINRLTAEYLNEDTRSRVLAMSIGQSFHPAIIFALTMWAFTVGLRHGVSERSLVAAPALLILLVAFFVAANLFPYIVGYARARSLRLGWLERQRKELKDVLDFLELPSAPKYISEIDALKTTFSDQEAAFLKERMVELGDALDRDKPWADDQLRAFEAPLRQLKTAVAESDFRFEQLRWLRRLQSHLSDIVEGLQRAEEDEAVTTAMMWARKIRTEREELQDEIHLVTSRKPAALRVLGAVWAFPVVSGLIGYLTNWAWKHLLPS